MFIPSLFLKQVSKLTGAMTCLSCLAMMPQAYAETQNEWSARALELQASIDLNAPFTQTTWVGTHNSTSNPEDDNMVDYNQKYSLKHQLEMGVRELVFDIHWDWGALRVCHNNVTKHAECSDGTTGNRKLKNALDDINDWIKDGHNDQVILLKLEFGSDVKENINKLEKKLEGQIGNNLYRPDDTNYLGDAGSNDCTNLPANTLTKADILATGANVIAYTSNNCVSDGSFNRTTFYDHDSSWVEDVNSASKLDEKWNVNKHLSVMARAKDGATQDGYLGDDDVKMHENNIMEFMEAGLNIVEVYGFGGGDAWRHDGEDPVGPEDVVWSWSESSYQPETSDNCAVLQSSDDRMASNDCSGTFAVACRDTGGDYLWAITPMAYELSIAEEACSELGSEFSFASPMNAKDMKALRDARDDAGQSNESIWVNYKKVNDVWTADLAL